MNKEQLMQILSESVGDWEARALKKFEGTNEEYYLKNRSCHFFDENGLRNAFLDGCQDKYVSNYVYIGYEFEGAILKTKKDKQVPLEKKDIGYSDNGISNWIYDLQNIIGQLPVDNMSVIAEFRTFNKYDFQMFMDMYDGTIARYKKSISWKETEADFSTDFLIKPGYYKINLLGGKPIKIESPLYRGGGLHVTVSGIKNSKIQEFVDEAYDACFDLCPPGKSMYRQKGLYRFPVFHPKSNTKVEENKFSTCVELIGLSLDATQKDWLDVLTKIDANILKVALDFKNKY